VKKNKFRLDLFHRLNTLHIHIPALRERPEDIKPLLIFFVDFYTTKFNKANLQIDKEVFKTLAKYDFPGNVRELRNMAERAVILCKSNVLGIVDFQIKLQEDPMSESQVDSVNLKSHEINLIRKGLQNCKYNQKAAADMLGITRDALIRKMKKHEITVSRIEN
jgi:DNA-binding NtrC family response regulator